MTSKERVRKAILHQQPDKVPANFECVASVHNELLKRYNFSTTEQLLQKFEIDIRGVGPDYTGNASDSSQPVIQPQPAYPFIMLVVPGNQSITPDQASGCDHQIRICGHKSLSLQGRLEPSEFPEYGVLRMQHLDREKVFFNEPDVMSRVR